ncbi:MAG: hypothetical protein LBQ31_03400 [Bacteroidales bacterium]|jgi:hypothetical protein|nr:hypothetical protein [Bacteroidales bacterium]
MHSKDLISLNISNTGQVACWANGKTGELSYFKSDGVHCIRFFEMSDDMKHYSSVEGKKKSPILLARGFIGCCIHQTFQEAEARKDTKTMFEDYLNDKLNQYELQHRGDPDVLFRDLESEFYSYHKESEAQLAQQSEAIFPYFNDDKVAEIKSFTENYFRYVDSRISDEIKRQDTAEPQRSLHFTRDFTTDEQEKLFDGLINGGFLPKETIYSHFCYVFSGTAILDNEKPFEPLKWLKTAALLAYMIDTLFGDTNTSHWKIACNCFTIGNKKPNIDTLKNAVSKHKNDWKTIKGHKRLAEILSA